MLVLFDFSKLSINFIIRCHHCYQ